MNLLEKPVVCSESNGQTFCIVYDVLTSVPVSFECCKGANANIYLKYPKQPMNKGLIPENFLISMLVVFKRQVVLKVPCSPNGVKILI